MVTVRESERLRIMYTLGIETSCDETACAILKNGTHILSSVISSSLARHKPFGGVVPEIASRHSLEAIDLVFEEALQKAKLRTEDLDLIAVTRGPGLIGSIFVGVSFAKALGLALDIPVVGVNHIEAHLEANFIGKKKPASFIGLIVSGGHTSLVHVQNGRYKLLGETVDDAIGEAYDKVAKLLGLEYPGGPVIDRLAQKSTDFGTFPFTKPKLDGKFDFSFSGVKTRALHYYEENKKKFRSQKILQSFCASFQEAVMSWISDQTILAARECQARSIVVGGGVSANSRLRSLLVEKVKVGAQHAVPLQLFLPSFELTTDNAAMIAKLGHTRYQLSRRNATKDFSANPSLAIGE